MWVEIDLAGLRRNYMRIAEAVRPARVMCVLKANAYGLGVEQYSRALAETDCAGFGVAEPFEALQLVKLNLGKPIQMLSSVLPDEVAPMVAAGVTLPVIDLATARRIDAAAGKLGMKATVHFKIDSGMGRLGIPIASAAKVVRAACRLRNLDCEGIFSHCPMAYSPSDPFTDDQIDAMRALVADLAHSGIKFRKVHIAASDAINNFPRAAKPPFNLVRTGINLHGSFDPNGRRALSLESVLTLKTRVAQVRDLPPGTTLGYGRTWCLSRRTRVATISAGYADGYPRLLSNKGRVLINGQYAPIIGRVCMDQFMVDATDIADIKIEDTVTLIGRDGENEITADEIADLTGTINYEVTCDISHRVERIYKKA